MATAASRSGDLVGKKLGKYELLALIAVGGTAEIYLARISGASGFEKYLVVKCLLDHLADDQEFVRMFLDEARVSAQLDHSNIVQTLELGEHKGRYFLVMEYLAGMSVAQLARKTQERRIRGGLIDTNLVLGLAAQTCSGLQYAHSKTLQGKSLNLVHRDISPQNLVVGYEGVLKIVDFGIAKSSIKEVHTRTGTIKGKFAYMSPEQCLAKDVDHRTDIFALGTLCHELLTGRRLFKRKTTYDTYQAIVSGGVPLPSKINPKLGPEIDAVIMKALEYKAEDRYQSAQEFGEALLELIHKRGGSAGPGDVARFFDENFSEDLDAHAAQMRELITGKKKEAPENTWDSEFDDVTGTPAPTGATRGDVVGSEPPMAAATEPRKIRRPTAPPPPPKPRAKAPPPKPRAIPSILPEAPDLDMDAGDDDEGPTRIEFNPADRVAAIHEEAKQVEDSWEAPTKHSTPAPRKPLPGAPPLQTGAGKDVPTQPARPAAQASKPGLPPVPSMQPAAPAAVAAPPASEFSAPPSTLSGAQQQGIQGTLMGQQAGYVNPGIGGGQHGAPQAPGGPSQQFPGQTPFPGGAVPGNVAPGNVAPGNVAQSQGVTSSDGVVYPQISGNFVRKVDGQNKAIALPANLGDDSDTPAWMHAAVFAAFVGLGFGVAAFIKMML